MDVIMPSLPPLQFDGVDESIYMEDEISYGEEIADAIDSIDSKVEPDTIVLHPETAQAISESCYREETTKIHGLTVMDTKRINKGSVFIISSNSSNLKVSFKDKPAEEKKAKNLSVEELLKLANEKIKGRG